MSIRSSGHNVAAAWTSGAPLNVTMPEKLTNASTIETATELIGPAREAVEDRVVGNTLGSEHVERVVPGVA